jgi:hypothetical protein
MDYANPTEIWWPHPGALDDLSVEFTDEEEGGSLIHLSAPDGTECADWLSYFNETEERRAVFERAFIQSILDQITMLKHGEIERITDQQAGNHPSGEEDLPGSVEEH